MAEHAPLTKQKRERLHTRIHTNVERALAEYDDDDWADMCMRGLGYILRYEATVVALEAENARLRPLAEVGKAVEAMPVGFGLSHAAEDIWLTWDNRGLDDEVDETCGQTALATLRELAALHAAKGEDDE